MKLKNNKARAVAGALALSLLCMVASAVPIHGITGPNNLIVFDSATPSSVSAPLAISGLVAGDSIVGIDYRTAEAAASTRSTRRQESPLRSARVAPSH